MVKQSGMRDECKLIFIGEWVSIGKSDGRRRESMVLLLGIRINIATSNLIDFNRFNDRVFSSEPNQNMDGLKWLT